MALSVGASPFTRPTCSPEELLADPANAQAAAYDVVLNGYELGGDHCELTIMICRRRC